MAEQDGRGSLSEKLEPVLYLPPRQRAYNRALLSVKRPSGAACESRTLEGVRDGARESWPRVGGSTKREPYPATLGGDRGHPCHAGGYKYDRDESLYCGIHKRLFRGPATYKENERPIRAIAFDDEDLKGMIQPHDDALVIAARISGFLVKRVMIDQGGRVDVMYPNLFKRLGFENQDLAKYESSLVSFDRRVVIPQG